MSEVLDKMLDKTRNEVVIDESIMEINRAYALSMPLEEAVVLTYLVGAIKHGSQDLEDSMSPLQASKNKGCTIHIVHTVREWQEIFPFFSESTVRRLFAMLVGRGFVLANQFEDGWHTNAHLYSVDFEKLDAYIAENYKECAQ